MNPSSSSPRGSVAGGSKSLFFGMTLRIISSARAWLPVLLRPHKSIKSLIECWSSYDAEWDAKSEQLEAGIKLGADMLIPALLLSLIGSFASTSVGEYSIDGADNFSSLTGALCPFATQADSFASSSSTASTTSLYPNFDPQYCLRLIALSIISPISIDLMFYQFAPILVEVFSRLRVVLMSRKGPDASTKAALLERVQMGRAIRHYAYDLYLPPPPRKTSNTAKIDNSIQSLLFFPGFGVDHSAYADVASLISDCGIPVAVASLEPLRLAYKSLVGGIHDVRHIIKSAGEEVVEYYKNGMKGESNEEVYQSNIIIEWALGGHSMGGYHVLQLAEELQTDNLSVLLHDGSISRVGPKIVAWACGTLLPNLNLSTLPLRVFILLASNDEIAEFSSQKEQRELISKLPKKSILNTIKGGNHSGFASYDTDSKKSGTFAINGRRDITLERQQEEAASRTARFLLKS